MNDEQDDDRVRSLLADVGSAHEALPADVAARLDETLTALVADREASALSEEHTPTGNVVPLRPRWMPRVAAVVAAIIVLGLGGLTAANLGHGGSNDAAKSSGSGGGTALQEQAPSASARDRGTTSGKAPESAALPQLRSATFAQDVEVALRRKPALRGPDGHRAQDSTGQRLTRSPAPTDASCRGPAHTADSTVSAVLLDSAPAALVVHPQKRGGTLVEAWSCDGTRRLASTTVTP